MATIGDRERWKYLACLGPRLITLLGNVEPCPQGFIIVVRERKPYKGQTEAYFAPNHFAYRQGRFPRMGSLGRSLYVYTQKHEA